MVGGDGGVVVLSGEYQQMEFMDHNMTQIVEMRRMIEEMLKLHKMKVEELSSVQREFIGEIKD